MIFLLDIILVLNLLWAYKLFKNILSPPVLLGLGMVIASFIATTYYDGWEMGKMCFETVLYLGGGSLFFTLSCGLFKQKYILPTTITKDINFNIHELDFFKIKILLVFLLIMGIFTCYMKYRTLGGLFGMSLNLSELTYAIRLSVIEEDKIVLPLYVRLPSKILFIFSFIISWILSLHIISNNRDKTLFLLSTLTLLIEVFDGFMNGNKAAAFQPIVIFAVIFAFIHISKNKKMNLNIKQVIIPLIALLILANSFSLITELLGRNINDKDKSSLFAIYCGAEVKNFDTYMRGLYVSNDPAVIGGRTFSNVYKMFDIKSVNRGTFQSVGNYELGNVYTMFYPFHKDFGGIGVFIMTFVVSIISMFFYNKSLKSIFNPCKQNVSLYLYSMLSLTLFMSFFSSRFTELFFGSYFLTTVGYLLVFTYFFDIIFLKKNQKNK